MNLLVEFGPALLPVQSDQAVATAITECLTAQAPASGLCLDVQLDGGNATLYGVVDNLLTYHQLAALVRAVRGVRSVTNRLTVRPTEVPDAALARELNQALAAHAVARAYDVVAQARAGRAILLGRVPDWRARQLVSQLVAGVRGVCEIDDRLTYDRRTPALTGRALTAHLTALLANDLRLEDALVTATADRGRVELSGVVASARERDLATAWAWAAGAAAVDGRNLFVNPWMLGAEPAATAAPLPDETVAAAVRAALLLEPAVPDAEVSVQVRGGAVTLSGVVPHLLARRTAERVALAVRGAWAVHNYLLVLPPRLLPDDVLHDRVRAALARDPLLGHYPFAVHALDGHVTLHGTVETYEEQHHAEQIVLALDGLVALDNQLRVPHWPGLPHPAPAVLTPRTRDEVLRQTLAVRLQPAATSLTVDVDDAVVVLSGAVGSWGDRQTAALHAYELGAGLVVNRLQVTLPRPA